MTSRPSLRLVRPEEPKRGRLSRGEALWALVAGIVIALFLWRVTR